MQPGHVWAVGESKSLNRPVWHGLWHILGQLSEMAADLFGDGDGAVEADDGLDLLVSSPAVSLADEEVVPLHRQEELQGIPAAPAAVPAAPEAKFDAHRANHFLTYPQTDGVLTSGLLRDFLKEKFAGSYLWCVIGAEDHQPTDSDPVGGKHLHAYLKLSHKVRIRDARFFDVTVSGRVFHPHIEGVKKGVGNEDKVISYCTKGKRVLTDYEVAGYPRDYCRRKADALEFARDFTAPRRVEWPVEIPQMVDPQSGDRSVVFWTPTARQRVLWIWGPAGWGKTVLWNYLFAGLEDCLFVRPCSGKSEHIYEHWNHQEVILCDDIQLGEVSVEEFIYMTNFSVGVRRVYGDPRYRPVFMKAREQCVFIVFSNVPPPQAWMNEARFATRVQVLECFGDKLEDIEQFILN